MSALATSPKPSKSPRVPAVNFESDPSELLNLAAILLSNLDVTAFRNRREDWRNIGIALKVSCGADAYQVWRAWSEQDPLAVGDTDLEQQWTSLPDRQGTGINFSTILYFGKPAIGKLSWPQWLQQQGFSRDPRGVIELTGELPDAAAELLTGEHRAPAQTTPKDSAAEVTRKSAEMWSRAKPATSQNAYIASKGLAADCELRELPRGEGSGYQLPGPVLLLPYFGAAGEFRHVQQIAAGKGNKRFLSGEHGYTKGTYGGLAGPLTGDEGAVIVVEGVGHAMAIEVAQGGVLDPTPTPIVAGSKHAMSDTAKLARELCPGALILIAADLDSRGNIAEETKLKDTAQQIGAAVIGPRFEGDWDYEKSQPDFCDIYQFMGAPELREQIREGLELARKAKEQGSLLAPAGEQEPDLRAKIMAERGIIDAEKPIIKIDISSLPMTSGKVLKIAKYKVTTTERAKTYYKNQKVQTFDHKGHPVYSDLFDVWLEELDRKTYEGASFFPYAGKLSPAVTGDKTLPDPDEDGKLNMFMGMTIKPVKGDCQPILNHIRWVWCHNDDALYDYTIKWMARMFQYPGEPGHTTLCVQGDQGQGKGQITDILRDAWGPGIHSLVATSGEQITAKFNASMATAIFVCLNEAVFSADKKLAGRLKAMITDEVLQVEPKFMDSYTAANCMHFIFTSNYDWIAPVELGDRRYVTLETTLDHILKGCKTDEERAKTKRKYFNDLTKCKKNGGEEAFIHYLLNLDLKGYNPREIPECNSAKRFEAVMRSLDQILQWWYGELAAGNASSLVVESRQDWEKPAKGEIRVGKKTAEESFKRFLRERWQNRKMEDTPVLHRLLKKACPGMRTDQKLEKHQLTPDEALASGAGLPRCYTFPSLGECRKGFEGMLGMRIDWGEEPSESGT